jgi:DNA-binding beta-propeller fold protein YncE
VSLQSGTIAAVAGTGERGFAVDGTAAVSTRLNDPSGLALDAAGALYFSEAGNCVVRRLVQPLAIDAAIETVAGWTPAGGTRPNCGFAGEGANPRGAKLHEPRGLAVGDDGTIYLADSLNSRVRAFERP